MPRYFFHIDDGQFLLDDIGTELPGYQEARDEAVIAAGEFLSDIDGKFWDQTRHWRMHVTDERSNLLFTLTFSADIPSGEVQYIPKPA